MRRSPPTATAPRRTWSRADPDARPGHRRLFGVDYDDAELLGRLVARGRPEAQAVGTVLHIQNGALFGALYAQVAPSLPVHPVLRGPLTALLEHVATWPAIALVEPSMLRNPRAFAMSAWRHLLFGAVLGELERRLNPPDAEPEPIDAAAAASNGHGSVEHLVATGP